MICPPDHKHGATHTCYNAHGCRCENCRTTKARKRGPYEWESRRRIGRDVWVDATGTVRRLRALATLGWSINVIAAETGLFRRSLGKVREGTRVKVHMSTYVAVAKAYEHLSMRRNETRAGRITRSQSVKRHWLPPLAWDDIDTDRTPPVPDIPITVDESAIVLAISGEQVRLNSAELREAVTRLTEAHVTPGEIATRLQRPERTIIRVRHELGLSREVERGAA